MNGLQPPFPDRLRRRDPRRRLSRWLLLPVALSAFVLAASAWRVSAISLGGCPGLPASVSSNLSAAVGTPMVALDLEWVRQVVGCWPAVAGVDVTVELPGTLRVVARSAVPEGSVRVGGRWLLVDREGRPAGFAPDPVEPVLERCPAERRQVALAVARRLAEASGAAVRTVRWVLPDDLRARVRLPGSGDEVTVHVASATTEAERWWADAVSRGLAPAVADLRLGHRVVLGGGGA